MVDSGDRVDAENGCRVGLSSGAGEKKRIKIFCKKMVQLL